MKLPPIPRISDHGSEIALLSVVAVGVMILAGLNHRAAVDAKVAFDPSAYLVVLTLIVGAVKERWTQRSVDRMGQQLGQSQPPTEGPTGDPGDPISVKPVK